MPMIVPPGGFAGFAQQATAVKNRVAKAMGGSRANGARRRARKAAKGVVRKRRKPRKMRVRTRGKKKAARLVKGSAAAKRFMAKIRRKRK